MYNLQNLSKYFQGDTVNILAGPKKQSFLVHQEALRLSGSSSLQTLVNGKWSESKNQIIDWCHTDVDTVSRICTFLYTGDYETPYPTPLVDESPAGIEDEVEEQALHNEARLDTVEATEITEAEYEALPEVMQEEAIVEIASPRQSNHIESDIDLQHAFLQSFNDRPLTPIVDINQNQVTTEIGTRFDITEYPYAQYCYSDILLAHAKLYAFAKYHLYPMLTHLALQRLIETLNKVRCEAEHAAREIAALADFVYEHVGREGVDEEPLRKIISHFVATNFTRLERSDLEKSLALGGDFTLDVLRKVSRRLRAEGELVNALKQENVSLKQKIRNLTVVEEQPVDDWAMFPRKKKGNIIR